MSLFIKSLQQTQHISHQFRDFTAAKDKRQSQEQQHTDSIDDGTAEVTVNKGGRLMEQPL